MKSGRIFWGTLFVVLGGLILLDNFLSLNLPWEQIWQLWPVVLILIGLSAVLKDSPFRWIINAAIAIVAGFVFFASVQSGCSRVSGIFDKNGRHSGELAEFIDEVDYDSAFTHAKFIVDGGAGHYAIADTTSKMIKARTRSTFGTYSFNRSHEDGVESFRLQMEEANIRFQGGRLKNSVNVSLNPRPLWDFDLNVGAAALEMDLTPFRVGTLALDAGAASIKMKLGNLNSSTTVNIDAGASSISILVPESSGCEIRADAELSSSDFIGFEKVSKKLHRTAGFEAAANKIFIEIDAGISSIEVRRYTGDAPLIESGAGDSLKLRRDRNRTGRQRGGKDTSKAVMF